MTQRVTNRESQGGVEQYLLWAVNFGVLLVLTTPIVVTTSTLFHYVVGKAIFSRSLIEIIFALWLILIFYYPRHRPPKSWVLLALGAWLLVSLISSFTGVSMVRSLWSNYERMQGIVDSAHWFMFILVAGSIFRNFSSWRVLFSVNLAVAVSVSILGLIQYYDLTDSSLLGSTDRIESTLGNATYMGAYMMVNVIIGFGLILQSIGRPSVELNQSGRMRISARHRRRDKQVDESFDYMHFLRAFWFIAIIVCLWSLWLTATRGAAVGLGVGTIVFVIGYISWGRIRLARRIAYLILAATIFTATLVIIARFSPILDPLVNSSYMLQRLTSIGIEDSSVKGRISSISAGLRAYQDKPILGWGPENYLVAWGRHLAPDSVAHGSAHFDQAHNKVIEELVSKGMIGLLSYLLIWLAMAWVLVRSVKRRQNHDQLWVLTLGIALVAFFVQNLFLFDSPVTTMQLAILMAFVVSEEGRAHRDAEGEARKREPRASSTQSRLPDWRRWLGSRQIPGPLRTPWGAALVAITVTMLTIWLLINYNVKPYSAAQAAKLSFATSWTDAANHFHRSEDEFYNLSNLPRRFLIERTASLVVSMTDEEFSQAVDLVVAEEREAMKVEPQNWRLLIELAKFYQQAAIRNSEYVEVARAHVDEAIRLAPNTPHTISVMEDQERIENLPE